MTRFLFLAHRYLGIAVGFIMLIWTLSGIIMMYQEYPELNALEQRQLLSPVQVADCCQPPPRPVFSEQGFRAAAVQMLAESPVLQVRQSDGRLLTFDLHSGREIITISREHADTIAAEFTARQYPESTAAFDAQISNDQWTVYSSYNVHRPLYRYRLNDSAGSELYVSSKTGEIVQLTTRHERVWGYLGAVIHWLYPTILRQHTQVWAQTVIWLSILGIFLTAIGLYVGIRQFRRRHSGRRSPYRGMALWHHYTGLIFGVLTLTWVFSGLFSMNPWGLLEGESIRPETQRLSERVLDWPDVQLFIAGLSQHSPAAETVRYELTTLNGAAQVVAFSGNDFGRRLDATTFTESPLSESELQTLGARLQPQWQVSASELLQSSDHYYYEHHQPQEFPVYRVQFSDDENRYYYLSPVSGEILRKIDRDLRWYRWLFYGVHRGDFTSFLRSRPVWDLFMVIFLLGVTSVCATGSVMAWRRLKRDLSLSRHRASLTGSNRNSSTVSHLPRGLLVLLVATGLIACSEEEEEAVEWIEVPLSEATYFAAAGEYSESNYDILVLRNSALEFKLGMNAGQSIAYRWDVDLPDPSLLNVEFHGHTHRVGEEPGTVMFYKIHREGSEQGSLLAPFDGIHGWYFDNQSGEDITINLQVAGFFEPLD